MQRLFDHFRQFDYAKLLGFLAPFLLALVVGLLIHAHSKPIAAPEAQTTSPSGKVTATTPATPPTAAEVANANAAILAYCSSDLRADTSCQLVPNSNQTAPGFVESGLKMTGTFEGTSPDGLALAKGSGSSWTVIWVGQNCIPQDIATQNNVPSTLGICQ